MRWVAVRTKPGCEKIAIYNLERQDYNYYQPKILERRKKQGKFIPVEVPLFPCYLFVEMADKWLSLQYTHGVAAVITMGSKPSIVQQSVIDKLRSLEVGGLVKLPRRPRFGLHDKVTIKDGPFAGQSALVERMPVKDRQKVLLALLENKISVLVDENSLDAD